MDNPFNLSDEELRRIDEVNQEMKKNALEEYKEFGEAFEKNDCFICKRKLDFLDVEEPCLHWLLNPLDLRRNISNQYMRNSITFKLNPICDG